MRKNRNQFKGLSGARVLLEEREREDTMIPGERNLSSGPGGRQRNAV